MRIPLKTKPQALNVLESEEGRAIIHSYDIIMRDMGQGLLHMIGRDELGKLEKKLMALGRSPFSFIKQRWFWVPGAEWTDAQQCSQ